MAFIDDKKVLIEILTFIRDVLNELVHSHITENKSLFQSAWSLEVKPHLDELILQFQSISREESPFWRDLQNRGLTGEQLKLKRTRLAAASLKGLTKRVLDLINTILGSIPGAESIKEFKEFAEDGLDDPNASIAVSFT
ncbi:MAG: hypothetical protein M3O31_02815 [Acidobacteriota bacterium]|nr:hypothetical protein [Acidobacteriota bacterium]